MNRRLFYAITVCIAITTNAHAQNEHRMTIGDMFGLIDQHNRTIRAGKTAVAAADEGVRAARSQRLPDVGAQVSAAISAMQCSPTATLPMCMASIRPTSATSWW